MEKRNICLTVAYDGTAYHGFQRQTNALSIQEVLEERLGRLLGHPLKIAGAARTDTGVHAHGQVVTFTTGSSIPVARIPQAARQILPPDIVVRSAALAAADFHARLSAKSKLYYYRIYNYPVADPLLIRYSWHIRRQLDVDRMQRALAHIIGIHDFSAFRASGGPPVNPVREIFSAECRQNGAVIDCYFHGAGFLYHMVRNLIGTLVDVGSHKRTVDDMRVIRDSRDRRRAGMTAPAQGLYLQEVRYEAGLL
ncbi:MAG: tRNA pseudouridine(38-40) synthase TruA [Sporomusaceae bacterium]|nr:tRNA pseudouridine(38-40) synthase TruA [Sporomusaceae bacterium]